MWRSNRYPQLVQARTEHNRVVWYPIRWYLQHWWDLVYDGRDLKAVWFLYVPRDMDDLKQCSLESGNGL
jgi:hypothetical protein